MINNTTFLTERGTLTLPSSIRKSLGLTGKQRFIVEITKTGEIILRPAASEPIENYSEERIAEFSSNEETLNALLNKHKVR